MARRKKKVPALNSSSMADISFLLLIFFLVTSAMDIDTGLARKLPAPPRNEQELSSQKVQKRNMLVVLVNKDNQTMVSDGTGQSLWYANLTEMLGKGAKTGLKDKVKEFVLNNSNNPNLPEIFEEDFGGRVGRMAVTSQHVISLQNDATTSYKAYIAVQNEMVRAYNELREEASRKFYGQPFEKLSQEDKDVISKVFPQRISEAEPKNFGGAK